MGRRAVSADDLMLAKQFLGALAGVVTTGDRQPLYPLLAPDVEWVTQKRDLVGIDDVRDNLSWVHPRENLDVEFEQLEIADLGDGRIVSDVHEVYRMKGTGDFAYACDRRIELTIRDGKIARYEMEIVG